ncbi:Rgd3p NDAI_0C03480 [Naumovozyma dairenensis CBS 421]|uniref:Uncharacterized protein n=1 Tax=Naumovozyma dairenensis (strain ATCC 10597 / BCRC 20456 / CBS 421 / NBRC 0211 / NRRL Y-12639) TaxID=1071378 RepID=G0W897_NAUDC|nr:hypothetical protein NDAI_0C03480 [Naumovozyma dairenensis CBS 421]CCD24008.1 hypothetical protein NDAI_0C03480 [Naumovozyma dairenensis CBS 421]
MSRSESNTENQTRVVKYTLRTTFWSKDYITGINTFLNQIKNDNKILTTQLTTYSNFQNECWSKFIKSLSSSVSTSDGNNPILYLFYKKLSESDIDEVMTVSCLDPLRKVLKRNEEFLWVTENELKTKYDYFIKDFKSTKEAMVECEKRTEMLSNQYKTFPKDIEEVKKQEHDKEDEVQGEDEVGEKIKVNDNREISLERSDTADNSPFNITYPFELDTRLLFQTQVDFFTFLNKLKDTVPVEKRMISIPGLSNDGFQGSTLLHEIKKQDIKIDTSSFNMDRIGQIFIDLNIIQENSLNYFTVSSSRVLFANDSYYHWVGTTFKYITASLTTLTPSSSASSSIIRTNTVGTNSMEETHGRKKKTYGELEHDAIQTTTRSISSWFRKISMADGGEESDTDLLRGQLLQWEHKALKRFCKLEYSRIQLEKAIFENCKKYSALTEDLIATINQTHLAANHSIGGLIKIWDIDDSKRKSNYVHEFYGAKGGYLGFFSRDNCIPFNGWLTNSNHIEKKAFLFGHAIDDNILDSITLILRFIENGNNNQELRSKGYLLKHVYQSWRNDIDLIRVANLRRELLEEFMNNGFDNKKAIEKLTDTNHTNVNILINDWVGLIKLWLLELPNCLFSSSCYDNIMNIKIPITTESINSDSFNWMDELPPYNIKLILEFSKHFGWLTDHQVQGSDVVSDLFYDNMDIPLFHLFIRPLGLREPTHVVKLSPIICELFSNKMIYEKFKEKLKNEIEEKGNIPALNSDKKVVEPEPEVPSIVIKQGEEKKKKKVQSILNSLLKT